MNKHHYRYFACDFETTVYDGQEYTEVWASASVELYSDDKALIFHSIGEQFEYFKSLDCNICAYYHNLKFDGNFWLSYLLNELNFKQAYKELNEDGSDLEWLYPKDMPSNSITYSISNMGQWYSITIKTNKHIIVLRDSLKLLPFTLKEIGKAFKTEHQKLEMEYTGYRYAGCTITPDEAEYIANDVYVLKEALEVMFNQGNDKLTIGSCCFSKYRKSKGEYDYKLLFPYLPDVEIDKEYGYDNADAYIRKSYRGGWCYVVDGKENKLYKTKGTTADVNSLYPSVMHSMSGNRYPYGKPCFWKGNFIPDKALRDNCYYFIRIKTRFYLKDGYLPFIQIKDRYLYKPTEMLKTSDVLNKEDGKYYQYYRDTIENKIYDTRVTMTLTMTDYEMIKEHYELVDFEILDGCWFYALTGMFDEYINEYKEMKQNSTGALRTLAKLYLNNLYGKFATSTDSSFKVAHVKEDGSIGFRCIPQNNKKAVYIPVGSAVTSYARKFTISAAQKNYHGVDERGFIYADTDSIHCDLEPEEIVGIKVDDKEFCCWKLESCWDEAIFARQKTYIEHITHEDLEEIDEPYYNIKCAGMPNKCKELFDLSMKGTADFNDSYTDEEREFLFDKENKPIKRTLKDFKIGLLVPDKLRPVRIKGGVLLVNTTYEMR